MVGGMVSKPSNLLLRRKALYVSPAPAAKSLYFPSTRVCFCRNNHYMFSSSSGVNRRLVLSVPHQKFDNFIEDSDLYKYYCCSSLRKFDRKFNKPFVVNDQSIISSSSNSSSISISVSNKVGEIKNRVIKMLTWMLLFGFLALMTTPTFRGSAIACAASTSSKLPSLSSSSAHSTSYHDDKSSRAPFQKISRRKTRNRLRVASSELPAIENELPTKFSARDVWFRVIADIIRKTMFLLLVPLVIPLILALIPGFKYYFDICKDDKEKSILMLQVGIVDKTRDLQRALTKIGQNEVISKSYGLKLKEVVKALLERHDSCRLAHLSMTRCISDVEKNYGDNLAELVDSYYNMHSIDKNPPVLYTAYHNFKYLVKSLAVVIHWSLKEAIKKISYGDKCSKELFREVFTRELARHDRDMETSETVDVMKYEMEAVGKAQSMVENDYLVVTILVLADGLYSIPSLKCSAEHLKTVLLKFDAIPETKIEFLKVLRTPHKEDEVLNKMRELQREQAQIADTSSLDDLPRVLISLWRV